MSFLFVPFLLKLLLWVRDFPACFPYPKLSSCPLTKVRNDFKSFVSLHLLLLFTQWRVYVFFTLPLQLFRYGVREFPAIFPSRYAHKRLSFTSAPLLFHAVDCVCVTVSQKNYWKCGATCHSYHQRLSGETTRGALRSSNVFSSRFAAILRWSE